MRKNLTSKTYYYERLAEANHNNTLISLVDITGEPITGWVHCKDYFQDMFFSFFHSKEDISVFGFKWKKEFNTRLEDKKSLYIVVNKHEKGKPTAKVDIVSNIKNVHTFFAQIGPEFQPKSIHVEGDNILFLYKISQFKYPVMCSLIMYLCRVSVDFKEYKDIFKYIKYLSDNALTYKSQDAGFLELMNKKEKINFKSVQYSDFTKNNIHNYSGFLSFLNNSNAKQSK
jgi:hypothetical protein